MMLRIVSNIRTEKILLNFQNVAYIKYAQIYNKSQINSGRKKKNPRKNSVVEKTLLESGIF